MAPPLDRFDWEKLVRGLPLTLAEKCTAYALATYVNGSRKAYPGTDKLILATGSSRSTVLRTLRALEKKGLIEMVSRGGAEGIPKGEASVWELRSPDAGILWGGDDQVSP